MPELKFGEQKKIVMVMIVRYRRTRTASRLLDVDHELLGVVVKVDFDEIPVLMLVFEAFEDCLSAGVAVVNPVDVASCSITSFASIVGRRDQTHSSR